MKAAEQYKELAGTEWIVGDCEKLPFDDESFHVIIRLKDLSYSSCLVQLLTHCEGMQWWLE